MKTQRLKKVVLPSIIAIIIGIGVFVGCKEKKIESNLGSFDNPELAFIETQKALALVSTNVNRGMETVMYIQEYEIAKAKIFIKQ
ncbi:hypothetical protein [Flavobacterium ovatum]|uniref:hypothetical protein n=1 Tax=Flavobacterium ovatum TaxID=1928857 RepID=UPI00344E79FF